jgi:hypothetical protein
MIVLVGEHDNDKHKRLAICKASSIPYIKKVSNIHYSSTSLRILEFLCKNHHLLLMITWIGLTTRDGEGRWATCRL